MKATLTVMQRENVKNSNTYFRNVVNALENDHIGNEATDPETPKTEFEQKLAELQQELNNQSVFEVHPPKTQELMDFTIGDQCMVLCVPRTERRDEKRDENEYENKHEDKQKMYVYFDSSQDLTYEQWQTLGTIKNVPVDNDVYNFIIYENHENEKDIVFAQHKLPNEMGSKHFYLLSYVTRQNLAKEQKVYLAGELHRSGSEQNPYYLVNFQSGTYTKEYIDSLLDQDILMNAMNAKNQQDVKRSLFLTTKELFVKKLNVGADDVQYVPGSLLQEHIVQFDSTVFAQLEKLGIRSYFFESAVGCRLFKMKRLVEKYGGVPSFATRKIKEYINRDANTGQPTIKPEFEDLARPIFLKDIMEGEAKNRTYEKSDYNDYTKDEKEAAIEEGRKPMDDSLRQYVDPSTVVPEIGSNRFEIGKQSGETGGSGSTFLAKDKSTEEVVAVKTFHLNEEIWDDALDEWRSGEEKDEPVKGTVEYDEVKKIYERKLVSNDDDDLGLGEIGKPLAELVKSEAEIQARAASFGAAPAVIGYNTTEDRPFIVMRKLTKTAADAIESNSWTHDDESQIVHVLELLNKAGIQHGDRSPLNFMQDDNGVWYAIDFGMAERVRDKQPNNITPMFVALLFRSWNRVTRQPIKHLAEKMPKLREIAKQQNVIKLEGIHS